MCPPFALITASTQSGILHTSGSNNSSFRASQEAIEASASLYEAAEALLLGLLCWMRRVGFLILRCRVPGVTSFINWGCISRLHVVRKACRTLGVHIHNRRVHLSASTASRSAHLLNSLMQHDSRYTGSLDHLSHMVLIEDKKDLCQAGNDPEDTPPASCNRGPHSSDRTEACECRSRNVTSTSLQMQVRRFVSYDV